MHDPQRFAVLVGLVALGGLVAILSNRLTERIRVPAPGLLLAAAAVLVAAVPALHAPSGATVEHLVTVALLCILFDGGMHIGWSRLRAALAPVTVVGVLGTFLTVAGAAAVGQWAFGLGWYAAVLVATAVAPTDPAVVFSVLGRREVRGHSGTILEGESGANDPVGIALMASLLTAGGLSAGAFGRVAGEFALQMGVGALIGVASGAALPWFIRRVPLPSEALYPLRTLAGVGLIFAVTVLAHGSGFLAVFVAGIMLGDQRAPYKREVERFHGALASLGEIVAFVVLGLTVDLHTLARTDVWLPGLILAVLLLVVIRPLAVGLCLLPSRLRAAERAFVLFAGLKGAVPILLGSFLLHSHVPAGRRLYGIVVVVVAFSVFVQAGLTPAAARVLRLPVRTIDPEPWALGVRLREEPANAHRFVIAAGAPADGHRIHELDHLPGAAWISLVVRDQQLVPVTGRTRLQGGDDVVVLAEPGLRPKLAETFERVAADPSTPR